VQSKLIPELHIVLWGPPNTSEEITVDNPKSAVCLLREFSHAALASSASFMKQNYSHAKQQQQQHQQQQQAYVSNYNSEIKRL
jgi:hypothetical protein